VVKFTYLGDLDLDGTVGFSDYLTLLGNFGTSGAFYVQGDVDYDGGVGFSDYLTLLGNFGFSGLADGGLAPSAFTAVPEPSVASVIPAALLAARRRRKAFTLVELLVVVGIVGVLVGILLPALAAASTSARRVACLSNLRQLSVAAHAYTANHNGRFPIAYFQSPGPPTVSYNWDFTTVRAGPGAAPTILPGLLWEGQQAPAVQQCPAFDGRSATAADPYTGYNYNTSYIGHGQHEAIPQPARITEVRRASHTALFGDGQWAGGANKFMRAPWENPGDAGFLGRSAGTQGFRHGNATCIAFVDGHADIHRDRHVSTYEYEAASIAPGTGFLSADNSLYDLE